MPFANAMGPSPGCCGPPPLPGTPACTMFCGVPASDWAGRTFTLTYSFGCQVANPACSTPYRTGTATATLSPTPFTTTAGLVTVYHPRWDSGLLTIPSPTNQCYPDTGNPLWPGSNKCFFRFMMECPGRLPDYPSGDGGLYIITYTADDGTGATRADFFDVVISCSPFSLAFANDTAGGGMEGTVS